MGLVKSGGWYYWVKRVPKVYSAFVLSASGKLVQQVLQALFTQSKAEAQIKAAQVEATRLAG